MAKYYTKPFLFGITIVFAPYNSASTAEFAFGVAAGAATAEGSGWNTNYTVKSVFAALGAVSQACFDASMSTTVATADAFRMAADQTINFNGVPLSSTNVSRTLRYNSGTTNLEYDVSGTTVLAVSPAGILGATEVTARPMATETGVAFSVLGNNGAVGFDTSSATLTTAFRMASGQFFVLENSGQNLFTFMDSTGTLEFVSAGNTSLSLNMGNGNLFMKSGSILQIGNAYTVGSVTPTGYVEITDSNGRTCKVPCA